MFKKACVVFLVSILTGCSTLKHQFSTRMDYSELVTMNDFQSTIPEISIIWNPSNFPASFEEKTPDAFQGKLRESRIPTGVAIASRLTEALDKSVRVIKKSDTVLLIKINNAASVYRYSEGMTIDYGKTTVNATFTLQGYQWTESFSYEKDNSGIGSLTNTKPLEITWDKVAVQMATSIIKHINQKDLG